MSRLMYAKSSWDNQPRATTPGLPRPSAAHGARFMVEHPADDTAGNVRAPRASLDELRARWGRRLGFRLIVIPLWALTELV